MSNVVAEGRLGPLVENTAAWNELKSELSETPASQAISSNELRALLEKLGAVSKKPRLVERAMELAYALSTEGVETYADLTCADADMLRAAGFNGVEIKWTLELFDVLRPLADARETLPGSPSAASSGASNRTTLDCQLPSFGYRQYVPRVVCCEREHVVSDAGAEDAGNVGYCGRNTGHSLRS